MIKGRDEKCHGLFHKNKKITCAKGINVVKCYGSGDCIQLSNYNIEEKTNESI